MRRRRIGDYVIISELYLPMSIPSETSKLSSVFLHNTTHQRNPPSYHVGLGVNWRVFAPQWVHERHVQSFLDRPAIPIGAHRCPAHSSKARYGRYKHELFHTKIFSICGRPEAESLWFLSLLACMHVDVIQSLIRNDIACFSFCFSDASSSWNFYTVNFG